MIELYEGVPGSGKSHHAMKEVVIPAIKAGKRLYVYIEGIYHDRLSAFTGIAQADLEKQVTVWRSVEEVLTQLSVVDCESTVVIDEAQTIFRAMERVDRNLLRWLEVHRHQGINILLCAQDHRQMSSSVTRLVEATTRFRKLGFVGLVNRYKGWVRGNPEDTEVIRTFVAQYDPAVWAWYSSYVGAGIRETRKANTVWQSPMVIVGIVGLLVAIWMFSFRPWVSNAEPVAAGQTKSAPAKLPPPRPAASGPVSVPVEAPGRGERVIIVGGGGFDGQWKYLLSTGEIMSVQEIALLLGKPVHEQKVNGVYRLSGEGVTYGSGGD